MHICVSFEQQIFFYGEEENVTLLYAQGQNTCLLIGSIPRAVVMSAAMNFFPVILQHITNKNHLGCHSDIL